VSERPRLFFLDNLRAIVIVMVLVLHASITYMVSPPTWWYVVDPNSSNLFTMLVLAVDVPLMPVLFFVAGYFAVPSLQRRGPAGFIREKVVRLAIPWALGVVFLAPLATYMTYVSRGVPTGYLQFWTSDFWGPMFQQSVYWFLGVLFVEFLVLVYAYLYPARVALQATAPRIEQPRGRVFLWFVVLTAGGSILFWPYLGLDSWQSLSYLLVIQPARIAFYVGYFALGIYAERHGWFTATGFRPALAPWGAGCVLTGAAYLAFRLQVTPQAIWEAAAAAILFSAFCLTSTVAGFSLFQRWLNGAGRAWRTLATNSFGIYYVHPLILYPLAYILVGVAAPSWLKDAGLVAVILVLSLAVSAIVLKRLPGLRRMF
jgi:surface polysaccharide O-acyltransferase-like enzyme